jgi:glycosyltransferase involved in cell wall biosynthesis
MRILYADTFTCYPLGLAGGNRSNHLLLRMLAARPGVSCQVVVPKTAIGAPRPDYFPKPRDFAALGIRELRDEGDRWFFDCGYPIWVVDRLEPALDAACAELQPDVLLTSSMDPEALARRVRGRGVATVCCVRDVRSEAASVQALVAAGGRLLACSHYMARWLRATAGVPAEVLYPLVPRQDYQVEPDPDGCILLINPDPDKGFDTFLRIAALLPEERFLVVESWPLNDALPEVLAALAPLPNVRFLPRLADVREAYRQGRLLLVPSKLEEAAGRVVLEAQWCGIPALVSERGGLPEMVGDGGLVIADYLDPEAWAEAIRGLRDPARRARLSQAARDNAAREEFSPDHIAERLLATFRDAIADLARREAAAGHG